jgi:GNAT superfamily N-acetyltransferase
MIRKAGLNDRDGVFLLAKGLASSFSVERSAFDRTWERLRESEGAVIIVLEEDNRIRGYLLGFYHPTFFANGSVGLVEELAVEEALQRKGFGRKLMDEFELWAKAQGCRLVSTATRRAESFYKGIGYEESATYFRKIL